MEATYQSFPIPGMAGSSKPAARHRGEETLQVDYQSFPPEPHRQAASLGRIVAWRARAFLAVLERIGQRRAAREIMRLAHHRYQVSHPEVAARLQAQAAAWLMFRAD